MNTKIKSVLIVMSMLVCFMLLPSVFAGDPAYTGQDPNALEVYNRAESWSDGPHITGSNTHGSWSYYFLRNDNMLTYGRGNSSVWVDAVKHPTAEEYHYSSPMPAFASFKAKSDRLEVLWNRGSNEPEDLIYREGELLSVFTVPEDGSYNVVGDLLWSCELTTDPRAFVHIGFVRAGEIAFNGLWSSVMLRDADNEPPFELIDPENPVPVPGFTDNSALKGIPLKAGDKLIIIAQSGITNYRKTNIHDSQVYIERHPASADATYNRLSAWGVDTHSAGESAHGAWSYHYMKGSDVAQYGRGESSYWGAMPYLSADDRYQFHSGWDDPAHVGYAQAYPDHLRAYYNRDGSITSEESLYYMIEVNSVFTVPQKGEYTIAGDLKWSNFGSTDSRAYVHFGVIKAGQQSYTSIWSSVMLRDADNEQPFEIIDPENPVGVPGFSENTFNRIPLETGDKIVISFQTGILNNRGINLHDAGLIIEQWPASEEIAFNRTVDMGVSSKSGNSHGTTFNPTDAIWQYWIKRQALDRLDYLPGELEAYNWNAGNGYFGEVGPAFQAYSTASEFWVYWNRHPDGGVHYNPLGTQPWLVATFKNPYSSTINFDILGETQWEKTHVSDAGENGILFEISKINASFTNKQVLWTHTPTNAAIGFYDIADPGLYSIDLAPGEYIAIAMRSSRSNHRGVRWHNSDLTIYADPDAFSSVIVQAYPEFIDSGVYPQIGSNMFVTGEEIEISAEDFAGQCPIAYTFSHWEVNDEFYSYQAQETIVVDSNINILAVFTATEECGDVCRPYPVGDLNQDCVVDLADFAMLAKDWLVCTDPSCY